MTQQRTNLTGDLKRALLLLAVKGYPNTLSTLGGKVAVWIPEGGERLAELKAPALSSKLQLFIKWGTRKQTKKLVRLLNVLPGPKPYTQHVLIEVRGPRVDSQ